MKYSNDEIIPSHELKSSLNVEISHFDELAPSSNTRTQRIDSKIDWLTFALVCIATLPQGPLGGLFFYTNTVSVVQNQEEESPGLYYLVFSMSIFAALLMSAIIINARAKVLSPLAADKVKNMVKNPYCERGKLPSRITFGILNFLASANISLVFAGLNLSSFDLMGEACDSFSEGCSDVIASPYVKAPFFFTSLIINLLLFYDVQKMLASQVTEYCQAAYRYFYRNDTESLRQLFDEICQSLRKKAVDKINIKLIEESKESKYIDGLDIEDLQNKIQKAEKCIEMKDFEHKELASLFQSYFHPRELQTKFKTPRRHYILAGSAWGLGMVGLWNFFYLQEIGIKFLLKQGFGLSENSATDWTHDFLNNGAKYLMVLNMGAFYAKVIMSNVLNFLNSEHNFKVQHYLQSRGDFLYKLWVFFLATVATLPNIGATDAALEDADISQKSFLGWFLMITSLLGPLIMEICGIHADYSRQALNKAKANFSDAEQKEFQTPEAIDSFRAQLKSLSSTEIRELGEKYLKDFLDDDHELERSEDERSLLQNCLRRLSLCCKEPKRDLLLNPEIKLSHRGSLSLI